MTPEIRRMLDEAALLFRSGADQLEMEGRLVLPEAMRKLADEIDAVLEKEEPNG